MTNMTDSNGIPPYGGYRKLKSYQGAEVIYDLTVQFCDSFIDKKSRTTDQMVQAARSGKQNIAEGSKAAGASPLTEVKLVSVARASLEELLLDYEDFLRQRGLPQWSKDDSRSRAIRALVYRTDRSDKTDRTNGSYTTYRSYLSSPEKAAHMMICLINQTNYLLDQQIKAIRAELSERGLSQESQQSKVARVLSENEKKQKEFDEYLKKFLKKEKDV